MTTDRYVFDTSSLMAILLDEETPSISVTFDEHVLDLTFYEAGNVLWKAHHLQGRIDADDTQRLVEILDELRVEVVVHELSELGTGAVLGTAIESDLTFYDAAHLLCAETLEATFITEDRELRDAAGEMVSVCGLDGVSGEDMGSEEYD